MEMGELAEHCVEEPTEQAAPTDAATRIAKQAEYAPITPPLTTEARFTIIGYPIPLPNARIALTNDR